MSKFHVHRKWIHSFVFPPDRQYSDGLDRKSFGEIVDYVIGVRFGWDQTVADAVKQEYTDWERPNDPEENRDQYVDVSRLDEIQNNEKKPQ